MTKQNIAITRHEDKTTKAGMDFTTFETNDGRMSCFEADIIKSCKDNEGKIVSVDVVTSEKDGKTYKNIRGFYEVISTINNTPEVEVAEVPKPTVESVDMSTRKSVKGSAYEKDPVGLCVEYSVGMKCNTEESINAIKQFREAFS